MALRRVEYINWAEKRKNHKTFKRKSITKIEYTFAYHQMIFNHFSDPYFKFYFQHRYVGTKKKKIPTHCLSLHFDVSFANTKTKIALIRNTSITLPITLTRSPHHQYILYTRGTKKRTFNSLFITSIITQISHTIDLYERFVYGKPPIGQNWRQLPNRCKCRWYAWRQDNRLFLFTYTPYYMWRPKRMNIHTHHATYIYIYIVNTTLMGMFTTVLKGALAYSRTNCSLKRLRDRLHVRWISSPWYSRFACATQCTTISGYHYVLKVLYYLECGKLL